MKTCKDILLNEDIAYEDRKEIYNDLTTIERYAGWLFHCAETEEDTKIFFDTLLRLISAQQMKREAELKEKREQDTAGMTEFERTIDQNEEMMVSAFKSGE